MLSRGERKFGDTVSSTGKGSAVLPSVKLEITGRLQFPLKLLLLFTTDPVLCNEGNPLSGWGKADLSTMNVPV